MDLRLISHYVDKGKLPSEVINLSYLERTLALACILQNQHERLDEKIALNPFLEKK